MYCPSHKDAVTYIRIAFHIFQTQRHELQLIPHFTGNEGKAFRRETINVTRLSAT